MKVIIAAAGTGGHINPGIAIANKIKEEQPSSTILFIGTQRGLENDLVPRAGYELKKIEAYGISREFTLQNIKKMCKTIKGIGEAKKIVEEFKPDIVIGTGGYICGPVILAAQRYNIPVILHESNAFPGITVKLFAKKVEAVLVGFKEAKQRLKKAKRVVVTGTPTKIQKMELTSEQKEEIKNQLGLKGKKPIVLVFGGSQGAKSINNAMLQIIEQEKNVNYQVIWSVGHSQYDQIKEELENRGKNIANLKEAKVVPYLYNMQEVLNTVDLIVARSGAMTITEIAMVGKPAIFIPFPNAAENHQEYNARVLEKVGAANIILDRDLTEEILSTTIENMIAHPQNLESMGKKARAVCIEEVPQKIYKEIQNIVNVPKK